MTARTNWTLSSKKKILKRQPTGKTCEVFSKKKIDGGFAKEIINLSFYVL